MGEKIYLGDSVYAEFNHREQGDVLLTTENGYEATNTIYLEPAVGFSFVRMLGHLLNLQIHKKGEDCNG